MVPRNFQELSRRRTARARALAERYPASREALAFCSEIAAFQQQAAGAASGQDIESCLRLREALIRLVREKGSQVLKQAAESLDESACREALYAYVEQVDTTSARSFFARVLLQPRVISQGGGNQSHIDNRCPHCGHPPQVGVLRPEGDGAALTLVCSLCLSEWPFPRSQCAACGERDEKQLAYYSPEQMAHLQTQTCDTCQRYLHHVDLSKELNAVPDVDEVAALPLDVWALERGFQKLHPNLVGI